MAISFIQLFGTIPLATFFLVSDTKTGIKPWKSWADTHSHYSVVYQIAGFTWKNTPEVALRLEIFRWSLLECAFLFFVLFGFSHEAREHYYSLYKSLTRCVGNSTSAPHGAPHVCVLLACSLHGVGTSHYWGLYNFYLAVLHHFLM